ncbi:MAG TPA: WbqC family protein [Desulfomonilia bacterium]|nr:WbqC family protein [Desulfomonilia bacterium]
MIVSIARPYFCPYPGYFARILASDAFVVLDEVQMPLGSTWITRNRFKNDQGTMWMGIPIWKKGLGLQKISAVKICHEGRWHFKHLESLKQAYLHAPYREAHMKIFERLVSPEQQTIVDMDMELISYVLRELGNTTRVIRMSELGVRGQGTGLIVDICRMLGASHYLAQDSAKKWLDGMLFEQAGIEVVFFKYHCPTYPQLWGPFIPNLSIFDLLFTCGPKTLEIMDL